MKILAFFICFLFSTSLFAATYATCSANDYSNNKQISLKLTWNKVFINENNKGLEEWKTHKYTNEEIVISKVIQHEVYKCDWTCGVYEKDAKAIKKREDLYNELLSKTPFKKKYVITVDRISGSLIEDYEVYSIYLKDNAAATPYTSSGTLKKEYTCEASDKTKF